jgi:hypothetical protein
MNRILVISELDKQLKIYSEGNIYTFDYITEKFLSLFNIFFRGYCFENMGWKYLDLYTEIEEEYLEQVLEALEKGEKFPINEIIDWEKIKKETLDVDYYDTPYVTFYISEILK